MRGRLVLPVIVSILILGGFGLTEVSAQVQEFTINPIAGNNIWISDVNESGQAVGISDTTNGFRHAVLWDNGQTIDLTPNYQGTSVANAINAAGVIVGQTRLAPGIYSVFIWENGNLVDLGQFGTDSAFAVDINDNNQIIVRTIVRTTPDPSTWIQRVLFIDGQSVTDIGNLGGNKLFNSILNNQGQIVGQASVGPGFGASHVFFWDGTNIIDVGANLSISDFNNAGQIAVDVFTNVGDKAGIWDGTLTLLPDLGGGESFVTAINDNGQIVGGATIAFDEVPVMWENGVITELTGFDGFRVYPVDINNAGMIVGSMYPPFVDEEHAFLWIDGVVTDLGTLGENSWAEEITDSGYIRGYIEAGGEAAGSSRTVIWKTDVVSSSDVIPPVISIPSDIIAEAVSSTGTSVAFTVTATDDTDGTLTTTCSSTSGDVFPLGSTIITCTSTDAASNIGSASFTIMIVDTTAPTITVSLEELFSEDDEGIYRVVITADDTVDPNPAVSANINGITVTNNQLVKLEIDDESESKFKVAKDEKCDEYQEKADEKIADGKPISAELQTKLLVCDAGGILKIEDSSFTLSATATDASGNDSTGTATPTFTPEIDDDDEDESHDDDSESDDDDKKDKKSKDKKDDKKDKDD